MQLSRDLFNKAEKHRKAAEYSKAIELYQKALALFKKESDIDGTLDCIISLADTFRAKGEFINAKKYYEEGTERSSRLSSPFALIISSSPILPCPVILRSKAG